MIIKSSLRSGFKKTGRYLEDQGENEKTRLVLLSDPHVTSIPAAFRAMWAIADGAKVKKPIHHVSVNPMPFETLNDSQIIRICSLLECKYGYPRGEHQKVVVEHRKKGRQHFHVAWSRVTLKTGRAHYPLMHHLFSFIAARQIETEFNLERPQARQGRSIEPWMRPVFAPGPQPLAPCLELDEDGSPKRRKRKDGRDDGGLMGVQSTPFTSQTETVQPSLRLDFAATARLMGMLLSPDRRQRALAISGDRRRLHA